MRAGFAHISIDEMKFFTASGCRDEHFKTYVALCFFRSKKNKKVWPTVETLSRMTGRPRRTTLRDIKRLRDAGLIQTERRAKRSTIYSFTFLNPYGATYGTIKEKEQVMVPPVVISGATQCSFTVPPTAHRSIQEYTKNYNKDFFSSLENLPRDLATKIASAKSHASERKKKPQ